MFWLISISTVGVLVLILSENLRRKYKFSNELSRKIVHSVHAVVVAVWPFFVSYKFIIVAELIFLASVLIAHKQKLFNWLREVSRKTWGEFFYPLAIIITALLHPPAWIFAVALLHLGLADSLAAVIGSRFGKSTNFKIFGYNKSLVGSATFLLVSAIITAGFVLTHSIALPIVLILPPLLTLAEATAVWGTDNLFIPLLVVVVLHAF